RAVCLRLAPHERLNGFSMVPASTRVVHAVLIQCRPRDSRRFLQGRGPSLGGPYIQQSRPLRQKQGVRVVIFAHSSMLLLTQLVQLKTKTGQRSATACEAKSWHSSQYGHCVRLH